MDGNFTESDKSVLILTPGFPSSENDFNCLPSIQGFVKELANQIGTKNIFIISFQYPFKDGFYSWNGIKVYSAGGKNKRGFSGLKTFYKTFTKASKFINENKIVAIHSFWLTGTALIGQILSKKYKIKHISSILGQDALSNNLYLKLLSLKSIRVIANSEFVSAKYSATTNLKVFGVIPIGLNVKQYSQVVTKDKIYDIIGCGSLSKLKQFDHFVEVIKRVKQSNPDIKSIIIGDGPEKQKLQLLIDKYDLRNNIKLLGSIDHPEILKFLSQSKIFLHTSRYEASSHAMLEANFCGLPTISYEVGYHPVNKCNFSFVSIAEMAIKIDQLLSTNYQCIDTNIPKIDDTVKSYKRIYGC